MQNKNLIIYGLSAALVGLILFSRPIARWVVGGGTTPALLGEVTVVGASKFTRKNPDTQADESFDSVIDLHHLDFIEGRGTLLVKFNQGALVELANDGSDSLRVISQWVPEKKGAKAYTLLHLIDGQMSVKKRAGASKSVQAYYRGRLMNLGSSGANNNQKPSTKVATKKPEQKPGVPKSLSKEMIRQSMAQQKVLFDKCYTTLLKENPKASGTVDVYFEVESNGRVAQAKIHKTNLKNDTFEKCVTETVTRTKFGPFEGKLKKVIFPLQFGVQ